MHIILIIFLIIVVMVVFSNLNQQGVIRPWRGPNNNLGCIPLLLVFIFTILALCQLPIIH
jgi:hypothetical protein